MPRTHVALGGGRSRARTCDPGLVRAVLFHLSYPPVPEKLRGYVTGVNCSEEDCVRFVPASLRRAYWRSRLLCWSTFWLRPARPVTSPTPATARPLLGRMLPTQSRDG